MESSPRARPSPATTAAPSVASGAVDAFEQFFTEHWTDVLAYARRRTATADDAHDVAAETFAVAWRRRADIPPDRVVPWLYRTAGNVVANHHRSTRRRTNLTDRVAAEPAAATVPVDVVVEDRAIIDAFSTLSADQQELLRLVAWEGLDHASIAAVLGISANAVASRLKRARAALEAATDPAPAGHGRRDRPRSDR